MLVLRRGAAVRLAAVCALVVGCGPTLPEPRVEPAPPPALDRPEAGADAAGRSQPGVRVAGRLVTPDGRLLLSATIILTPADAEEPDAGHDAELRPDGVFEFRGVSPGRYQIRARGHVDSKSAPLFARFGLRVEERDVTGVEMVLLSGATVSGRLVVATDASTPLPSTATVRIRAPFADGSSFGDAPAGPIERDGAFTIAGIMAGSHVIRVEGLEPPWTLERVAWRGQDVTETGFDVESRQDVQGIQVVVTDRSTEVTGRVLDGSGTPVAGATVVAVPPTPPAWSRTSLRVKAARTDDRGGFRLHGLPPGEYRLTALPGPDANLHRRDRLQARAASGAPIAVARGESKRIDLRVHDPAADRQ